MPTREELLNQLERIHQIAHRQEEEILTLLGKLDQYPEDVFEDGDIIIFTYRFPHKYHADGLSIPYSYAAIKFASLWYSTGPKAPKEYRWDQLIAWWEEGKMEGLCRVTEVEELL